MNVYAIIFEDPADGEAYVGTVKADNSEAALDEWLDHMGGGAMNWRPLAISALTSRHNGGGNGLMKVNRVDRPRYEVGITVFGLEVK